MIKPLEWYEGTQCEIFGEWIADTPFGRFRIITTGRQFMLSETPWGKKAPKRFASVDEAKQWAAGQWIAKMETCLISAAPTTASEE